MISKVISNSSLIKMSNEHMMVAYTINAQANQIVFSSDGILYMRSDKFGMILNNSYSKNENVKKKESGFFNKYSDGVELLFEINKVYVTFVEENFDFKLFCFNYTSDGSVIYTEMDEYQNDFMYETSTSLNLDYDKLCKFLYDIDDSYDEDCDGNITFDVENPVIGKFIITDGVVDGKKFGDIAYANFYNSGVIYKDPLSFFSKSYIQKIIEEAKYNKRYSFISEEKSKVDFPNVESIEEFKEEKSHIHSGFTDRILQTMQENSDMLNDDSVDVSEYLSEESKEHLNEKNKISITSDLKNFIVITEINSLKIYKFCVYCCGEDEFEVQYSKVNLEYLDDVRVVFNNLRLK